MATIKTDLPCPVCDGHSGSIYKNTNEKTGEPFFMYKCFGGRHGPEGYRKKIEDPRNYVEELMNTPTTTSKNSSQEKKKESSAIVGLVSPGVPRDLKDDSDPWGNRGLKEETLAYYDVTVSATAPRTSNIHKNLELKNAGQPTEGLGLIFPYFDGEGNLVAQKVRTDLMKKGSWYKASDDANKKVGFFGQQLYRSQAIREIVVTFGEFDAMAVHQMMGGIPTVSITNGDQSAPGQFRDQYLWLSRFDRITLVPDNDDSGRMVTPILASMFPRKTRIVTLTKYKDPCEYLQNNDRASFAQEFHAAQAFSPEKILALSQLKNLLFEDPPVPIATYPWDGLNKLTGGIWAGELVTVKAPPKVGKTSFFSEIAYHLHMTTDKPIGLIYLEETQRDLVYRFASLHLSKNLQRQEVRASVPMPEIESAFDEFLGADNIFVVDHFGSCSSDFLESKITEFVKAKGCQFIFFDHISMAITDESNKDERLALDRLVNDIKTLTVGIPDEEIDDNGHMKVVMRQPTVFMITHVNDNGQPRGSRAAVQISNTLISLSRDKLAATPQQRNLMDVVVEENRRLGESGLACRLFYDRQSGRMHEVPIVNENEENADDTPVMDRAAGGGYVYNGTH